jgi:hypothetical protein
MDRFSRGSREAALFNVDQILADLRSGANIVDVAKRHGVIPSNAEEDHLRNDWYNETGKGWWPDQPVAEIVRKAYIEAIRLAHDRSLPVDAYQVVGGERFAVSLSVHDSGIVMLFHTPPLGEVGEGLVEDENIMVIESGPGGNVVARPGRKLA